MSATGLFIIGVLVTVIVAAAMALLVYAAILDGRDAAARKAADREPSVAGDGAIGIDGALPLSGDLEASNGGIPVNRELLPARH
jgi:hypothetical protein